MSFPPPENKEHVPRPARGAAVAQLLREELALFDAKHVPDFVARFRQIQDRDAEAILKPRDDAAAKKRNRIVEPRIPLGENLQRRERPALRGRLVPPSAWPAPFALGRARATPLHDIHRGLVLANSALRVLRRLPARAFHALHPLRRARPAGPHFCVPRAPPASDASPAQWPSPRRASPVPRPVQSSWRGFSAEQSSWPFAAFMLFAEDAIGLLPVWMSSKSSACETPSYEQDLDPFRKQRIANDESRRTSPAFRHTCRAVRSSKVGPPLRLRTSRRSGVSSQTASSRSCCQSQTDRA